MDRLNLNSQLPQLEEGMFWKISPGVVSIISKNDEIVELSADANQFLTYEEAEKRIDMFQEMNALWYDLGMVKSYHKHGGENDGPWNLVGKRYTVHRERRLRWNSNTVLDIAREMHATWEEEKSRSELYGLYPLDLDISE